MFTVGVAILVFGIVFYYVTGGTAKLELSILKDIIFFFLSVFLSYSLAIVISRSEYKKELEKLGNISVRRVGRLSENIRQIARALQQESVSQADELFRIAKDADESTNDILLITEITENRTNSEVIFCPYCGFRDTVVTPEVAGMSEKLTCRQCRRPYNLHRVLHGIKIVPIVKNPVAAQAVSDKLRIKCPNPMCTEMLFIKPQTGKKELFCFNCHYSLIYDFDNKTILSSSAASFQLASETFQTVESAGGCPCPKCGSNIDSQRFFIRNKIGERFAKCLVCDAIVVSVEMSLLGAEDSALGANGQIS